MQPTRFPSGESASRYKSKFDIMSRRTFVLVVACSAIMIGGIAAGWAILRSSRQPELPEHVATAAPTPKFIGIQGCAECHADKVTAHSRSGHSRTFGTAESAAISRRLDGRVFTDPNREYEHRFRFGPDGLSATIPKLFGEREFPLQYVFGSGRHAVSFLTLYSGQSGKTDGLEYRVTAFGPDEKLGLTPGHGFLEPNTEIDHFGKTHPEGELLTRCIQCHTTDFKFGDKELTHVIPNVTCESCHGPGERHVAAMRNGESEMHIQSRWSSQAQLEMCGVCHRRTDWLGMTPEKTDKKIVRFQPVGLSQSACYLKSKGKLNCTTCHDPHDAPSENRPSYDAQCLKCHQQNPGTTHSVCPISPTKQCVECHMPRIELHKGFVFSDHWIRIRNASDLPAYKPQAAETKHAPSKDDVKQ